MRTLHLLLAAAVLALGVAGCGGAPTQTGVPAKAVPAEVITVLPQSVPDTLQAPGSVQARDRVVLSAQINGFVREVRARAGDVVTAGQVLVTLDARDADSQKDAALASVAEAQAALAEARQGVDAAGSMRTAAKASLDLADETYARYQKLFNTRSVSPQELDEMRARRDAAAAEVAAKDAMVTAARDRLRQVEARIAQANAQLRRADVNVGWATIRAPSSGRVVERHVDPGTAIFPGSPLLTLESITGPQVLATVSTTDASHVRIGMPVRVCISDRPTVEGRISEIIPVSSLGSHTIQFKVDLPAGFSAVSGSYVTAEVPTGSRRVLLVPSQAVRESGQLTGVFVVDNFSRAHYRLVKVAPHDSGRLEVLAGIEPGERIVARLSGQVIDGVALEIRQ